MSVQKKNQILFVLTAAAALVTLFLTACASPQQNEASVPAAEAPVDVQRVTPEESKAAFDSGEAVFLDVRSETSYAAGHIPGALSIPLSELQSRMGELDSSQWIITYCTWPAEETSARAAEILMANGFTRVNPILGGLNAWKVEGYPVESSQ